MISFWSMIRYFSTWNLLRNPFILSLCWVSTVLKITSTSRTEKELYWNKLYWNNSITWRDWSILFSSEDSWIDFWHRRQNFRLRIFLFRYATLLSKFFKVKFHSKRLKISSVLKKEWKYFSLLKKNGRFSLFLE